MNVRGGYDLGCGMRLKVSQAAFVAKDLLAVVGTIALLMLVVIPSGASNQNSNKASLCVANLRQLVLGWQLYASDNADRLVHNLHGGMIFGQSMNLRCGPFPRFSPQLTADSSSRFQQRCFMQPARQRVITGQPGCLPRERHKNILRDLLRQPAIAHLPQRRRENQVHVPLHQ